MTLVVPHPFVAGEVLTATKGQTLTDAITQLQGGTPSTGGILDFAALRQTVTQSIPNTTWTALTLDTEDIDTASGHSTSSNTSRYVAVQTGWYEVKGTAAFASNATGSRSVRFAVNGSLVAASQTDMAALSGVSASVSTFATVYMTAGDYVEVQAWQNSGGALSTICSGSAASRMVVKWAHA